ncbi:hypothetical protein GHT06_022756 [Daphnia sinensis]|uniref:Uncharacterized protein n=1 Tax=Daphnia sinensis TaxID=1820382 RepID=A0AAD5PRD3_9CRUS|nr:hypothetical protein GHT06_022756 [Daphnia sinensis]
MRAKKFSAKLTIFMIFSITGITLGDNPALVQKRGIENNIIQEEDASNNAVSTVSEKSTISLKNERGKCVEYLESSLKEFLQKTTPPTSRDSATHPGTAIDEILHKKTIELMSNCKGAQIDVKQHVITEVDSCKRNFEQLVIQRILLKVKIYYRHNPLVLEIDMFSYCV